MHGVISLPDATSYDENLFNMFKNLFTRINYIHIIQNFIVCVDA